MKMLKQMAPAGELFASSGSLPGDMDTVSRLGNPCECAVAQIDGLVHISHPDGPTPTLTPTLTPTPILITA